MKQVKEEIIDLEYDQDEWNSKNTDDEALMVARRIKREFDQSDNTEVIRRLSSTPASPVEARSSQKSPLIFDHFICMRIGLNSTNNVQRLMALLTAHEFVDLTVLPTPSMQPAQLPMLPIIPRLSQPCPQEASTSKKSEQEEKMQSGRASLIMKAAKKPTFSKKIIKAHASDNCGLLPMTIQCRKCNDVIPKGTSASLALMHVQKNHLKMAAFQCRICKHYRTTQERIQSHVTTVHKAKSTTFDSSLAGPLSNADLKKMEKMITQCFSSLNMELVVTDRLYVKSFRMMPGVIQQ